ncbi:hypothetical protein Poli38472_012250 [Pythium oligandrum]|uniref:Guanylate-binding protein N-terminal domain-containing protein n=1 Tax=Pythium oligandrum TaxID=41045 RepID=A0A8K1CPB6_PYTOL|nr:hypothetical protein Poli38472_012250 [Pythium oligandrum]|eukprot:TMW67134.1 hypothetical protein Poli38472_012250 [Pythium oligandrum]
MEVWTALPLAITTQTGAVRLHEDARQYLQSLEGASVHVVGVMGPPHTGKRLFLRTLLHAETVDFTPPTLDANDAHVLVWLWRPTDAKTDADARVRLVLSADSWAEESATDRKRRLALLLLLSSVLVYNDDGEINGDALERLAWLKDVASALRIKPNQDDDGVARDFQQHAPKLLWVVQNSKVKWLVHNETGEKINAKEYLEQAMTDEAGFSDAVMTRNTQRMFFHSFFKHPDCVALSRAVEGTQELSATTSRDLLRSQFVESIDQLYASYISDRAAANQNHLPPKSLLGRQLRAEEFAVVLDAYVNAMNANALPAIQTAVHAVVQRTMVQRFDQARGSYEETMSALIAALETEKRPVNPHELEISHRRGVYTAILYVQEMQSTLPDSMKKTAYQEALRSLQETLSTRIRALASVNEVLSSEQCDQLLNNTLPATLEETAANLDDRPRESFSDGLVTLLTQYKSELRTAIELYRAEAAGPSVEAALENALLASVVESVKAWGASILRLYQQHMRGLQEQRTQLESEVAVIEAQDTNASFSTDDHKRLYEEQLEQATEQLSELRRVLHSDLNDKKSELERLLNDMSTLDLKHEARVRNLESDLEWVRSRTAELEKAAMEERQRLENDVSGATDEMLVAQRNFHQEERSLMTQQKELLARVVELERDLVAKKTKHVQQVFTIESEQAKQLDELKVEHAEFARQLKAQAKTDTGVLRLAYQRKKAVVQSELDTVMREIREYEEKLQGYQAVQTTQQPAAAASEPESAMSRAKNASFRTKSRQFLFQPSPRNGNAPTVKYESNGDAAAAARRSSGARSDTDMCKTQ